MNSFNQLRQMLLSIDRKSYPAYKSLKGSYQFEDYILQIDHVQGDPFASPSKVSILIPHRIAGYPSVYFDAPWRKTALEDHLIRQFHKEISRFLYKAKGSGKSGLIAISRPGPEILDRTACECKDDHIVVRFEVGFPANGRTICSGELIKICFDFLPVCVRQVFLYKNQNPVEIQAMADLADDQQFLREELSKHDLVAFVANQAILPRESGVSGRPMTGSDSIPFQSPPSLQVSFKLPHYGTITGMGIPKGVTLIVGGGYHGKSTLLKALEAGVYNHIAGDGREYVITENTALKLRAEDGRSIRNVDISLFINDLPNKKDTRHFSTRDASGSTSQAAAVIEGIEAGSQTFLIDEDTSATNFMIRDDLMQHIISREKEPITPFIERVRSLYDQAGISTVMVAGSSGAYFYVADTIIQMDHYRPIDITVSTKAYCADYGITPISPAPGFFLPSDGRRLEVISHRSDRGLKIKVYGKDSFQLGNEQIDLRFVEQLVDSEQTAALARIVSYCVENQLLERLPLSEVVRKICFQINQKGLSSLGSQGYAAMGLCMPRTQEIFACLNRYRG